MQGKTKEANYAETPIKVSIVTPSFNQAPYLERTLVSVKNQFLDLQRGANERDEGVNSRLGLGPTDNYEDERDCNKAVNSSAKNIYSQQLDLQRGANERGEGVYTRYITEAEGDCNKAVNSSAKSIIEHIVFDGGSSDTSIKILSQHAASTPNFIWTSEKDKGQSHAVNKGILASKGEIIGWLNSDDVYYKGAIQEVLKVFSENPDIDVIYGMADYIDKYDNFIEEYPTEKWDPKRLLEACYVCQPALFFRRKIIEQYGLLDENLQYCMDYEYWLRLSDKGVKFLYLPKKLACSRLYKETKTLSARVKVYHEICQMMHSKYHKVPDSWVMGCALAVMEEKIDKKTYPRLFYLSILLHSFYGSLKWNKTISKKYLSLIKQAFMKKLELFGRRGSVK